MIPIFFQLNEEDWVLPLLFSPPIREETARWRRETPLPEKHQVQRFVGEPRAVNVHKLLDGTYTEIEGIDPALIDVTYRGATTVTVTDAEAASLVAAGYSVLNYTPEGE